MNVRQVLRDNKVNLAWLSRQLGYSSPQRLYYQLDLNEDMKLSLLKKIIDITGINIRYFFPEYSKKPLYCPWCGNALLVPRPTVSDSEKIEDKEASRNKCNESEKLKINL